MPLLKNVILFGQAARFGFLSKRQSILRFGKIFHGARFINAAYDRLSDHEYKAAATFFVIDVGMDEA